MPSSIGLRNYASAADRRPVFRTAVRNTLPLQPRHRAADAGDLARPGADARLAAPRPRVLPRHGLPAGRHLLGGRRPDLAADVPAPGRHHQLRPWQSFGLEPQLWTSDPILALPAIMWMSLWKGLGFYTVIYLAGLQTIPPTIYEAAMIDGAAKGSCSGRSRCRCCARPRSSRSSSASSTRSRSSSRST